MKKYAKNQAKNSFLRASQKNYGFYVCLHTCVTTLKPCFLVSPPGSPNFWQANAQGSI